MIRLGFINLPSRRINDFLPDKANKKKERKCRDLVFSFSHPTGMPRPPRGAREAPDPPPPRRNAFTKISEPAKIAVSCLTVPQGLCAVFNPGQKAPISYQTPLVSHAFAEVMFTPQITETVVYQCAEHHIQQQV